MSPAATANNPYDDGIRVGKPTKEQSNVIRLRCRLADPAYQKAARSGKAECIAKVASHARGGRVKALMEYVARTEEGKEPVELETEDGALYFGKEDVQELYREWSEGFEKQNPESSRSPRHATHLILSGNAENTPENRKKLLSAGRDIAVKHFGDRGYNFVMALHEEGGKAHVHVVVRNRHRDNGPKLRLNPPELLEIRTDLAERLTELGIEHVATLRKDRPKLAELVRNGIEQIEKRESQFQRRMKAASPSVNAILHRQATARNIVNLREAVKRETLPLSPKRKELLDSLRQLERQLIAPGADIKKEIAATLKHFEKETDRFRGFVKDFKDPDLTPKAISKDRQKSLDKLAEGLENRIRDARMVIQTSPAPDFEKRASLALLKEYEKEVSRSFQDPDTKIDVKPKILEGYLYKQLEKLDALDTKFNQDFRFGRADRSPGEHNQAIKKTVNRLEEQIKNKSLMLQGRRMDLLDQIDDFRAKHRVRAEVWQGIKNLETLDREKRPRIEAGRNEDISRLRNLIADTDHFNDKDVQSLTTSFDRMERTQDVRHTVANLATQNEDYWKRVEAGRAVPWPKEEHPGRMSKAIEEARKQVKSAEIPDHERKALFGEVAKIRQTVARDEIRAVGADQKIKDTLTRLDQKDRQHWKDRVSVGTEADRKHSIAQEKGFAEIREKIKAGKFPAEERKKLYQAVIKQEFDSKNREAAARATVKIKADISKIVNQDMAFYKGLQTEAGSTVNKIKKHQAEITKKFSEIRKDIKEARLPTDDRRNMYRQVMKAELTAQGNEKNFNVTQDVTKKLSGLVKKTDQLKAPGRTSRKEFNQHKAATSKELGDLRKLIKESPLTDQERRKLFRETLKAEAQVPKAKKLMTPEVVIRELKAAAEKYQAALKKAGKNPKTRKQLEKEMEKRLDHAARIIRTYQGPDVEKFQARKQLNRIENNLGLGKSRGL